MSDAYHCRTRPYKVSFITSPKSLVSELYLLPERWINILQGMRWLFSIPALHPLVRCASDLVPSFLVLTQSFQLGGMTIHAETGNAYN